MSISDCFENFCFQLVAAVAHFWGEWRGAEHILAKQCSPRSVPFIGGWGFGGWVWWWEGERGGRGYGEI